MSELRDFTTQFRKANMVRYGGLRLKSQQECHEKPLCEALEAKPGLHNAWDTYVKEISMQGVEVA